jgi:plastocyanin domain-containing protein
VIVARDLNLEWKLKKGENVQEFTPGDKDINFSCWMGMIRGVIKVVDNLGAVDTSKADPSLPPPSKGPSCCAVPLGDDKSTGPSTQSIYGDDITKVPTDTIINKAEINGKNQNITFKGINYELKPLIGVASVKGKIKLTFDFKDFDYAEEELYIVGVDTGKQAMSFTGKKGITEVEFSPPAAGGYAIIQGNNNVLGIIQVVDDDLKTVSLEDIRKLYLP